jgi:predicted transcriptional regulator
MSRPKIYTEPRVATAVRLPSSLHDELQTAATARDVSVNFLVTRAVSAYLAQLPPPDADLPAAGEAPPT